MCVVLSAITPGDLRKVKHAFGSIFPTSAGFVERLESLLRNGHHVDLSVITFSIMLLLRNASEVSWISPPDVGPNARQSYTLAELFTMLPRDRQWFPSLTTVSTAVARLHDRWEMDHVDYHWPLLVAPSWRCLHAVNLIQYWESTAFSLTRPSLSKMRLYLSLAKPSVCGKDSPEAEQGHIIQLRRCFFSARYLSSILATHLTLQTLEYGALSMRFGVKAFMSQMSTIIKSCPRSLEVLDLDVHEMDAEAEVGKEFVLGNGSEFAHLTRLRRLALPWHFVFKDIDSRMNEDCGGSAAARCRDVLPSSLEVLVLRHCDLDPDAVYSALVCPWLDDIQAGKATELRCVRLQAYRDPGVLQEFFAGLIPEPMQPGYACEVDEDYVSTSVRFKGPEQGPEFVPPLL